MNSSCKKQKKSLMFSPFANPLFRGLWFCTLIANIGTWMHSAAAAWLMTTLSPSPFLVALVQLSTTLPIFLFAIPAGIYADHISRAKFLFFVQIFIATIAVMICVVTSMHWITPLILLILTFLLNTGIALRMPTWQAAASELVDHDDLPAATSLNNLNYNIGRTLGPSIAGFIINSFNIAYVFSLNALSLLGTIIFFQRWSRKSPIEKSISSKINFLKSFLNLFLIIKSSPSFIIILLRTFIIYLSTSALWSLLAVVAVHQHFSATQYGWMMGCIGGGAISGPFILAYLRQFILPKNLIESGAIVFVFSQALLTVLSHFYAISFALIFSGAAWSILLSTLNAQAQGSFPQALRAKAIAVYLVVFYAGSSLGSIIWGYIAETSLSLALRLPILVLFIGLGALRLYSREATNTN